MVTRKRVERISSVNQQHSLGVGLCPKLMESLRSSLSCATNASTKLFNPTSLLDRPFCNETNGLPNKPTKALPHTNWAKSTVRLASRNQPRSPEAIKSASKREGLSEITGKIRNGFTEGKVLRAIRQTQ
jgi:hypothetical protein